jgi:hypothetical protein
MEETKRVYLDCVRIYLEAENDLPQIKAKNTEAPIILS